MLTPIGAVSWVYLKCEKKSTNLSQTAYVEMGSEKDAARVIVKWNGAEWHKRVLRVRYMDLKTDNPGSASGSSWPQMIPDLDNNTDANLLRARLAMRNLPKTTGQLQEDSQRPEKKLDFAVSQTGSGIRWYIVALVMLALAALIYASYHFSHINLNF
jgi:RNA recognition motif-containing protein